MSDTLDISKRIKRAQKFYILSARISAFAAFALAAAWIWTGDGRYGWLTALAMACFVGYFVFLAVVNTAAEKIGIEVLR